MEITEQDLAVAPELKGLNSGNVSNILNNFMLHFPRVAMVGPTVPGCHWMKPMKVKAEMSYYKKISLVLLCEIDVNDIVLAKYPGIGRGADGASRVKFFKGPRDIRLDASVGLAMMRSEEALHEWRIGKSFEVFFFDGTIFADAKGNKFVLEVTFEISEEAPHPWHAELVPLTEDSADKSAVMRR